MKFHPFIVHILQKMQDMMGDEAEVSLQEIVKNNGVVLTGLTFTRKNINISPTKVQNCGISKIEKKIDDK